MHRQRVLENGDVQREAKMVNYEVTGETEESTFVLGLFLNPSRDCTLIFFFLGWPDDGPF